jgi:hypothetical protein
VIVNNVKPHFINHAEALQRCTYWLALVSAIRLEAVEPTR